MTKIQLYTELYMAVAILVIISIQNLFGKFKNMSQEVSAGEKLPKTSQNEKKHFTIKGLSAIPYCFLHKPLSSLRFHKILFGRQIISSVIRFHMSPYTTGSEGTV